MATRIVSWSGDEHIVSPNLSKTPSVISVDSILSDKPGASPSDQGAPFYMAESEPTHTASQIIGPNGINHDGSFMRHNKYFFKDGNVKFLVRDV